MINIIEDPQIRTYELTYLVPVSFTESELAAIKESVTKLVAKYKGKVVATQDWGKKNLAYTLRYKAVSQEQAYFVHLVIEMSPDQAPLLEKDVNLDTQIMRHLLIKTEQNTTKESKT